jgi:uncharacterized lipoprotein YmbA
VNAAFQRLALTWLVSAGAACSSAPIRYHTLIPPPDKPLRASEPALAIDVRVAHIPPPLNRSELVIRTGPTETSLLENERWASSMKDEIKEAVRLELRRRLGAMAALPSSLTKLAIDIDVQRLEAELGRYARLEASWSASSSGADQRSGDTRVAACTFQADEAIQSGYAGMVEGYQREIAAFADAIAAVLTSSASGFDAPCRSSIGGLAAGSGPKNP